MKVMVRLNRKRTSGTVLVRRETGDPWLPSTWPGESRLLHLVKKALNAKGWHLVKRRMWRDGHLTDDARAHLRSRVVREGRPVVAVFDGKYMLRSASEDFTNGLDVRLDMINLGDGRLSKPRKTK